MLKSVASPLLGLLGLATLTVAPSAMASIDGLHHGHHHNHAQQDPIEAQVAYAAQRNEAGFHPDALSRFRFDRVDEASMQIIADEFSIEYREGDRFTVLVPPWRVQDLEALAPKAKLIDEDINPWIYNASYDYLQGYRDYGQVLSTFQKWEQEYPDIVAVQDFPYMKSRNGKQMIVVKITKDAKEDHPNRPNIVITSATHGDERLATESLLVNLEKLLKGYESNERFKKMIDWGNIYIVPVVSPDSFLRSRNVHGVDPNRVYDYPGKSGGQTRLESAVSMIKFYQEIEPVGALDFHGAPPNGMIMYPWGYSSKQIEDAEDRKFHDTVARAMGKTTPRYDVGPIFSTIYPAKGGTVDHNYMHHDMLAIVIEIGGGQKSPPISAIPGKAKEVEEATWIFVEALLPKSDPNEGEDDEKSPEDSDEKSPEDSDKKSPEDSDKKSPEDSDKKSPEDSDKKSPEDSDKKSPEDSDKKSPEDSDKKSPEDSDKKSPEDSDDGSGDESGIPSGCSVQPQSPGSALLGFGLLAGLAWRRRSSRS